MATDVTAVPPEAYEAAAVAYDEALHRMLDSGWTGRVLGEKGRSDPAAIRAASEREEQPLIRLRSGSFVRTFEVPEWAARIAEGNTDAVVNQGTRTISP